MIGRLLCKLGWHRWVYPNPYHNIRFVCKRCGARRFAGKEKT